MAESPLSSIHTEPVENAEPTDIEPVEQPDVETVNYSEDFETTDGTSAVVYSDDFESTSRTIRHSQDVVYSEDFESLSLTLKTSKDDRDAIYSDDFDTLSRTTKDEYDALSTARSIPTDFSSGSSYQSDSETPPTQLDSTRPLSQSVAYSDTFVSHASTYEDTDSSNSSDRDDSGERSWTRSFGSSTYGDERTDSSEWTPTSSPRPEDVLSRKEKDEAERQLEVEYKAAEQEFIDAKMKKLKEEFHGLRSPARLPAQSHHDLAGKYPDISPDEQRYMRRFIKKKLRLLQTRDKQLPAKQNNVNPFQLVGSEAVEKYGISSSRIHMLQMQNTLGKMSLAAQTKIHEPKKCRGCREQGKKLAEQEFIRRKTALVTAKLVNDKLERHQIFCNDQVGLMGEALRGLPSLNDDPQKIMEQLLAPLKQ